MTVLDIQTAKEISELLKEGKSLDEIRKLVDATWRDDKCLDRRCVTF